MLKSPYDAVPQTPLSPRTPSTASTPGTPQYNESYPLTARDPSHHYPASPPSNNHYSRLTNEAHLEPDNSYNPITSTQPTSLLHQDLMKQDQKLKRRIRILRFISRVLITGLTVAIAVEEGRTLLNFLETHNDIRSPPGSPTPRGPWALQTQLWSAVLLFITCVITAILGLISVISYLVSIKAANSISSMNTKFGIATESIHIATWIAVATAYRVAKNGKDLWGWACSPLAEKIQPTFQNVVNFKNVCDRSGVNFKLSIANSGLQVASLGIWILVYKRMRTLQWLKRAESQPKF
ncbi:uncharacterized protein Bfra_006668 [Botrytis fragariae]|uniref:MARVEL domain-containing protein n=1 Tax=Botrytis fragariae TaxID=1964551 RepID=A0A8H6B577_9HELO|nr:uncharacterized protein Bfra_006668 [Botrytis fragariae]KAF5879460.1 hypothetical protein Bfra_006668 [Botrytis fragariae]